MRSWEIAPDNNVEQGETLKSQWNLPRIVGKPGELEDYVGETPQKAPQRMREGIGLSRFY